MPRFASLALALALTAPAALVPAAQARDGVTVTFHGESRQHRGWHDDILSPRDVADLVEDSSPFRVRRVELTGDTYTVQAADRRGRPMTLTVDPWSGRVLAVTVARAEPRRLPFASVAARLAHRFEHLVQTGFSRGVYVAEGFDDDGYSVRLDIDARTAKVLRVTILEGEDCERNRDRWDRSAAWR
jgi:hypothetical protein